MTDQEKGPEILVKDRSGIFYSIPVDEAQKYMLPAEDHEKALKFYSEEEPDDDVTGQQMVMDARKPIDDGERWLAAPPHDILVHYPAYPQKKEFY